MTNAEIVANIRRILIAVPRIERRSPDNLMEAAADALEKTTRERDEAVARLEELQSLMDKGNEETTKERVKP